jgi:hypothetical protein
MLACRRHNAALGKPERHEQFLATIMEKARLLKKELN